MIRHILEQTSLSDAIEIIQTIPHASGENYLLSDFERVLDFECTASQIRQYIPFEGAGVVYHTNHPLINDDLILPLRAAGESTFERFKFLEFRLKGKDKLFTLETAKAILRTHYGPICRHQTYQGISGETEISVIYVLTNPPQLLITKGSPCLMEYQQYTF